MSRSSQDRLSTDESASEEKAFLTSDDNCSRKRPTRRLFLWLHLIILTIYTAIFIGLLSYTIRPDLPYREDLAGHPLRDAIRYKKQIVDYNFEDTNPYIGQTQQEIDDAWLAILNAPHEIEVSKVDMLKANITSIQFNNGMYMTAPMVYHMLHCLYNLHRYAHIDFYGPDPAGNDWMMKHSDHCIDNLRQFVQCHAGSGLETWKWLPNRKIPWPVLSTEEICVDWDHFHGWVQDHSVSTDDMRSMRGGNLLTHPTLGSLRQEDLWPEHKHKHPA